MKTEVINAGKADEIKFERHEGIGFTITTPNGNQTFMTDEMLDALVDFQRDSYIAELQTKIAVQESYVQNA
jgi:hypothetical protein